MGRAIDKKYLVYIRNGWKSHTYLRLLVYIVITSLFLYWQYIFGDKVLVFLGGDALIDTSLQYIPVYEFFASGIKNGNLSSYTFQYGFGNSIFRMIGWVSNPFAMIGVLVGVVFGQKYIADSMVYILILKHICAGLLCLYFLGAFAFSKKSSMISAYVYAFSGYMTTLGGHYNFANYPIYLILLLIVLEKTIKGEHKIRYWCGLLYMSALVTFSGVRSAYEIFLAAAFYSLFRVLYIYGKNVKEIVQRLGICLAFVVCGICVFSFTLFPSMEVISESTRLVHSVDYLSFFDSATIKSNLLKLFSNHLEGTFNSWFGGAGHTVYSTNAFPCFFTVMLVPIAAQFVWRTFKDNFSVSKKIFRMIPVAVVIFAVIDQFVQLLFSFFVSSYHCYVYIFLPLYAVLFAEVLDNVKNGAFSRLVNYITMMISIIIIVFSGITTYNKGGHTALMWMMFSSIMLMFGCFALDITFLSVDKSFQFQLQDKITKTASVILTAVIVLNLFCENYITMNYERLPATKEKEHTHMIIGDAVDKVNGLENNNFVRLETQYFEGRAITYSYPFLFPMRATGYYDSALNNRVPEFYDKMFNSLGAPRINNYLSCCTRVQNTITEDILGVKYRLCKSDLHRNGWEKIDEYPEQEVLLYKNLGIDTAALLFDSYVTQESADQMSFNERAIGMPTRLIIDAPPQNIDNYAMECFREKKINEFKEEFDNIAFDADAITAYIGNITDKNVTNNQYHIRAILEANQSNICLLLNKEIINDSTKATQITFRLKDANVVHSFNYFDEDNRWNRILEVTPKTDGEETVYTFVIPQAASHLALTVNKPCDLDCLISSKTIDISQEAIDLKGIVSHQGRIINRNIMNNQYHIRAALKADQSNICLPLNTEIINDSKKATQVTFRLKDDSILHSFNYFDADNRWNRIPEVTPEVDGEEKVYTFIIPQVASHLALSVNKPCELDCLISSKTVTATYISDGIHFDNPDRGNILTGTVEAQKNSLLYLPIPYHKYWNAYIDGEKVDIIRANYAFIAVPITAGQHHVNFIYVNRTYHKFLKVSIISFVVVNIFFIVYFLVRYKRKHSALRKK